MNEIELVIKIPEEKYDYIKKQVAEGIDNPLKIYIAKGILLPKGHGRLKDIDAIIDTLDCSDRDIYVKECLEEDAPTIIKADTEY